MLSAELHSQLRSFRLASITGRMMRLLAKNCGYFVMVQVIGIYMCMCVQTVHFSVSCYCSVCS